VLAKLACCGYAVNLNPLYAWAVPPQSGVVHEMAPASGSQQFLANENQMTLASGHNVAPLGHDLSETGHDLSETFGHLSAEQFRDDTEKTTKALWNSFTDRLQRQHTDTCTNPKFAVCLREVHWWYKALYLQAGTESVLRAGAFGEFLQNMINGNAPTFPKISCSEDT